MVSVRFRLFSEQPHTPNFFCVEGLKCTSRARDGRDTARRCTSGLHRGKIRSDIVFIRCDAFLCPRRCVWGKGLNDAVAMEKLCA